MSALRVALVSQPRDSLEAAGPQSGSVAIVLAKLAHALADRVDPIAIAPRLAGEAENEIGENRLAIHRVASGNRNLEKALELLDPRMLPRLMRPSYYRGYFERAAKKLAELSPDVVHVMTSAAAGIVFRRSLPNVPLVLHLHDSMLLALPAEAASAQIEPFDAVVTCSDWLAGALRRHLPKQAGRIWHVGNGIDPTVLDNEPLEDKPAIRSLLMVGRISPEKGPHVLLDAFRRLAGAYPDLNVNLVGPLGLLPLGHARLLAVGQPEMAKAIDRFYGQGMSALSSQFRKPAAELRQRLLAQLPSEFHHRVRLAGFQPHDRLSSIYRSADVLVQPSICTEGFGLPVAEAMIHGRAVVASELGGLLDLVEPQKTGLLVPPGDGGALADALAELIDHPETARQFGRAGRRRAVEKFTWKSASDRLADVYQGLDSSSRFNGSSRNGNPI